ncbi:MAG: terminase small subunit, partial [Clostridiales bacterium]|nr:terminase small subunit [Clostridiales bacterium]
MIEYLVDLNATLAAVRAGYSEKTANEQGERLLSTNSVKEQIAKEMDRLLQNTGVNQDQVIRELAKVAFYSVPDIDGQNEAPLNKNIKNEDKVET